MIIKEDLLKINGMSEKSENNYIWNIDIPSIIVNGIPQTKKLSLELEVDSNEDELGTYIIFRSFDKIIFTGYYTDINDLLSSMNLI